MHVECFIRWIKYSIHIPTLHQNTVKIWGSSEADKWIRSKIFYMNNFVTEILEINLQYMCFCFFFFHSLLVMSESSLI